MKKFEIGGVFNTVSEFSSEGALAGPGKRKRKLKRARRRSKRKHCGPKSSCSKKKRIRVR